MKKISIKQWAVICACTAALTAGAITLRELNKPVVLELGMFVGSNWGVANANSYVIIDKAIERFESEHKNVKVLYDSGIQKVDYSEWFARRVLSGNAPDVFMVLSSDFYQFSSMGIMKNLDGLMQSDESFHKDKFFTTALDSGKYGGTQYALPYEIVPTLMFVNKSLLLSNGIQVPSYDWTWNDFYDICSRLTQDSHQNEAANRFGTLNFNWYDVVTTNGAYLFDADGKQANFTDERVAEAIRFSKQIYDLNHGQKVTQEDFDNGNVAFMPLLFAEYRTYKTYPYKIKKYTSFQWDCITMPSGKNGGNTSSVDSLLIGINSRTRHEKLAWEFLKLLTYDEELQTDIFRYSQGASALRSVTNSIQVEKILQEEMEEGERIISHELLSRVIEEGSVTPRFPNYIEAMALAENEVNKIFESNKNIDQTLKYIQRTVSRFLVN
ncbi:MAG: extracellular solute-binding protein [Oscillospiraceae bacterium]|nr:extracellular solute-binding protein [Oscillospiraceae bacterium]